MTRSKKKQKDLESALMTRKTGRMGDIVARFFRNKLGMLGLTIIVVLLILVILAPLFTKYPYYEQSFKDRFVAPCWEHPLGTDNFGRDIFSRVLEGAGTTLFIAVSAVAAGLFFGILIGAFTGWYGGWVDEVLMRVADVITAFPSILLALVLISLLGSGKYNIILALTLLFIPSFSRVVRSEYAKQKELDYVRNARLMGVGTLRIMFVHILPNVWPVLLSSVTIGFNNAVLAEAAMSYVGIGVLLPDASLGRMLSESQAFFFSAPWYALSAGLTIVFLILGVGLISDGLGEWDNA